MAPKRVENFISVDVETAGPTPGVYSLLSIGACLVFEPEKRFYVELQPVNEAIAPGALQISGLDVATLEERGLPPRAALERFADWVEQNTPPDALPIFAAFNAPFDWMFVADYFQRYLGRNPFGHKAFDIKACFMGMHNVRWSETGYEAIAGHYGVPSELPHNALEDAVLQAQILHAMLLEQRERQERITP
jgi:DNA polymerase III epsilon subunit-like protein